MCVCGVITYAYKWLWVDGCLDTYINMFHQAGQGLLIEDKLETLSNHFRPLGVWRDPFHSNLTKSEILIIHDLNEPLNLSLKDYL